MSDDVIKIEQLVKYFDGRCVLDDINLTVQQGCIYGLLGRNGAGKTTLMKIMAGVEGADDGQVHRKKGIKIT